MEQDIHKLADWLEKVTHEGIAVEHKILEWKAAEEEPQSDTVEETRLHKAS